MCADPEEQNLEDGPLFDDDTSKPIEAFPRVNVYTDGWEMFIRHPPKKKMTAQRFWKKIFVRLIMQGDHTPSRGGSKYVFGPPPTLTEDFCKIDRGIL